MVGILRSKACKTCRKRKKGCDQKRPGCGQCGTLGIKCEGYVRELVFVNSVESSFCKVPSIALHNTLACSAYKDGYIGHFWATYLPSCQALSSEALQSTLWGWKNTIQALYQTDDTLEKAFLALCLLSSKGAEGQEWMSVEGMRLYGSALQDMAVILKKQSQASFDSIFATAKLLGLFEALHGADDTDESRQAKSCMLHFSGELAILLARGPDQYTEGHAHRLFVYGRLGLIAQATRARKKTILSEPEWKTIPWSHYSKTERDRILDILVEIPTLLEESDIMCSWDDSNKKDNYRQKLIEKCWLCDNQLAEWYARQTLRKVLKPIDGEVNDLIDAVHLASAHLMTLYWATCIILYGVMHEIAGPNIPPLHLTNIKSWCRKIIRTLPIFFHPSAGTFGTHLAMFPTNVAMAHISVFEREERLIEERLLKNSLKRPEGLTIWKLLKSVLIKTSKHQLHKTR